MRNVTYHVFSLWFSYTFTLPFIIIRMTLKIDEWND